MSEERDRYDVIVVGSGGGLFGAYAAAGARSADAGDREVGVRRRHDRLVRRRHLAARATRPRCGAGLEGGSAAARPYLDAIIGDDAPVALREAYLEAGPRMIEELEADPAIGEFEWRGVPDYFADAPGALRKGRTIFPAEHRPRRARRSRTARAAPAVDRTVGRRGTRDDGRRAGPDRARPAGVHEHRQRRDPHEHRTRAADRRGRPGRRRRSRERR